MQLPQTIELRGIRVLTTRQLAEFYDSDKDTFKKNFAYNRKRFIEGEHYIPLEGAELKAYKVKYEIYTNLKFARILYLWTEKGALLYAKLLNTNKAWEVYDYLTDFYFRVPKNSPEKQEKVIYRSLPQMKQVVNVPENPQILNAIQKINDDLTCMNVLLERCKRYLSKREYLERCKAAEDLIDTLREDWNILTSIKPKIVEKNFDDYLNYIAVSNL